MDRSDKDKGGHPLRTWEIRCRAYYHSDRERVFGEWFSRSNPRPPDKIEQALGFAHAELMAIQSMCSSLSTDSTIPPSFQHDEEKVLANEYAGRGFPMEAFSPEVIKWEYVSRKRHELQRILEQSNKPDFEGVLAYFKRTLECPFDIISMPPSAEEIRVTTGWRIEYLRRLRREGTDESYIEAYKKAWNLSEDDLREEEE